MARSKPATKKLGKPKPAAKKVAAARKRKQPAGPPPPSAQQLIDRALSEADAGNFAQAATLMLEAAELERADWRLPGDVAVMMNKAIAFILSDRDDEGRTLLHEITTIDPIYAPAYFELGNRVRREEERPRADHPDLAGVARAPRRSSDRAASHRGPPALRRRRPRHLGGRCLHRRPRPRPPSIPARSPRKARRCPCRSRRSPASRAPRSRWTARRTVSCSTPAPRSPWSRSSASSSTGPHRPPGSGRHAADLLRSARPGGIGLIA